MATSAGDLASIPSDTGAFSLRLFAEANSSDDRFSLSGRSAAETIGAPALASTLSLFMIDSGCSGLSKTM